MARPSSPNGSMREGCEGLWATGDTSWEFGPQRDFSKLLEFETRLEEFLQVTFGTEI